jgi:hypothetical protein
MLASSEKIVAKELIQQNDFVQLKTIKNSLVHDKIFILLKEQASVAQTLLSVQ